MKSFSNFIISLIAPSVMLLLFYFGVIENIKWVSTTFFTLFYILITFCMVFYISRCILINKVNITDLTYRNIRNHLGIAQQEYIIVISNIYNSIILLGLYSYGYYGEVVLLIFSTVVYRCLTKYTERKTLDMLNINEVIKRNCKPDQYKKE